MQVKEILTNEFEGCCEITITTAFGEFFIRSGFSEEYLEETEVKSKFGKSKAITLNGQYFLSWHCAAAMIEDGNFDYSWIKDKTDQEVVEQLLEAKKISDKSYTQYLQYIRNLTGSCVY